MCFIVKAKLSDIVAVNVGDTTVTSHDSFSRTSSDICTGHRIMLHLRDGLSLGVTRTSTTGDRRLVIDSQTIILISLLQ